MFDLAEHGILPDEQERALARDIARRGLATLGDVEQAPLFVGILGGTGVGKSTIINALAGQHVSEPSHRRPHTDRAVVYMHEAAAADVTRLGDLAQPPRPHRADRIRHLVLCDLPDYDSLVVTHRERVGRLARFLDVFVWVASPEKYGDRAMYEAVSLFGKAEAGFLFVVNKMDTVPADNWPRLKGHFHMLLEKSLEQPPRVYLVSAADALEEKDTPGARAFHEFRDRLFGRRMEKQAAAIRAANIEVEASRWAQKTLDRAGAGEKPRRMLELVEQARERLSDVGNLARGEILDQVAPDADAVLADRIREQAPDPWPVRLAHPLTARALPGPGSRGKDTGASGVRTRLAAMDRKLSSISGAAPRAPEPPSLEDTYERFIAGHHDTVRLAALAAVNPLAHGAAWFWRRLLLAVPVFLWVLFMAGITNPATLFREGGLARLGMGLPEIPLALFTERGLTAILVLLVIEAALCVRISAKSRKWTVRRVRAVREGLSDSLARALVAELERELTPLADWAREAVSEYETIAGELARDRVR